MNWIKRLFKSKHQLQKESIEARVVENAKNGNACIIASDLPNEDFINYMNKKYGVEINLLDGGTQYKVFRIKTEK